MMRGLLRAVYELLHPVLQQCPVCLREVRGEPSLTPMPVRQPEARLLLNRLCGACRTRIPWIWAPMCPVCGRPGRCFDCLRRKLTYFNGVRCSVQYRDEMRDWLADYKYRGAERYTEVMAAMLSCAMEQLRNDFGGAFDLITAVPLAPGRLEERGFNQAERMAAAMAAWYGIPYRPLLKRTRDTEKQSGKARQGRIADMRGLFAPADGFAAARSPSGPLRILIADDIYTTGSTMNDCARAVLQAVPGAQVYGIAWSRS
ncbi:ComF family protein [Cohnella ginsengisoli]|uniref:ComF family protein n=1 Tax=Cohnella ginsengisoli TaxID=425004 RepID=A0A9X4KLT6_9BACL|nr:ComF family protein [Cohnella ginsengisoli]MDG0794562.1 ComF family protein [Cohnella ginsengisoli]